MIIRKKYTAVTVMLLLFCGKSADAQQRVISRQDDMLLIMQNPGLSAYDMRLALFPANHTQENFAARWPQAMVKAEKIEQIPADITEPQYTIEQIGCNRILAWQDPESGASRENKIILPHRFEVIRFVGVTHDNKPILEGRFKENRYFTEGEWEKRLFGSLQRTEEQILLKLTYDDRALQAAQTLSQAQQALLDKIATFAFIRLSGDEITLLGELPQEIQDNVKNNSSLRAYRTPNERFMHMCCSQECKRMMVCSAMSIPLLFTAFYLCLNYFFPEPSK